MPDTTIVNTPASNDSSASVVVSLILIMLILAGGFIWYRYYRAPVKDTTNINISVPLSSDTNKTQ